MTLLQVVEQFLYTHAAQMPHKKQLLEIIRDGEETYLRRIAELEQDAAIAEFNKVVDDSGLERLQGESPAIEIEEPKKKDNRWPSY